jgi:hypothetical protein
MAQTNVSQWDDKTAEDAQIAPASIARKHGEMGDRSNIERLSRNSSN